MDGSVSAGGSGSGGASGVGGVSSTGGVGVGGASGGASNNGGASNTGASSNSGGAANTGGWWSAGGSWNAGGWWSAGGSGGACQPTTWCHDQDGDQHGDPAQTQSACASPGSDWTSVCDDCDDTETLVHPGADCQVASYTALDGVTLSFDYDCDGVETECGTFVKAAAGCTTAGIGVCAGGGYLPNPNRTASSGQDAYCGSTAYRNCIAVGVPCVAQATTMTAITCQ